MQRSLCVSLLFAFVAAGNAQTLSGLWDASVKFDGDTIPFPIEFSQNGSDVAASFFNGDDRVTSTSGKMSGNLITVNFAKYGTELKATLANGELKGTYGGARNGTHDFEAKPHGQITSENVKAPDVAGVWYIAPEGGKGARAWRLIVKQKGSYLSASILRADGMTGPMVGGFQDGKFLLNKFDGLRASILQLVPKPDGTLDITWKTSARPAVHVTAVPLSDAIDDGLPQAAEPVAPPHGKTPGEV